MLTTPPFASLSTPRPFVVRWPAMIALLAVLLIPFARPLPPVGSFTPATTTTTTTTTTTLPAPLRASLFAQVGQDDPASQLQMATDGTIHAPSITGMETTLDATTLRIGGTQPTWQWMLQGWGREANLIAPAAPAPAALHTNQVHFAQGGLDSWYVAGAGRIEQGWTIAERPSGNGPLLLSFAESGSLHSTLTADGLGLDLRDASGFSSLRYAGLMAFDATGRTIAAHFAQRGNGVAIVVDDATASYPLTIDPWVESATLTAAAGGNSDNLGWRVALSGDGNTLVASAPFTAAGGQGRGAAYVYTKPIGGWTSSSTPDATLTAGVNDENLGYAVAISADGSIIVAGAPNNAAGGPSRGAVYVFTKGSGWIDSNVPDATLTVAAGASFDYFGYAVAISGDGSTIVASSPYNAAGGTWRGAAYMYTKPVSGWTTTSTPDATLTATGSGDYDRLGNAVAISADGNTVVAGAPYNAGGGIWHGAAYVFTKGANWADSSTPNATLTAAAGADYNYLGYAVAISSDDRTIVAGAYGNAAGGTARGAAYVFSKGSGAWADSNVFNATLTAAAGADNDNLGRAVAISADGNTVVAGAPYNAGGGTWHGAAYVFSKGSGAWADSSAPDTLTAAAGADYDQFGNAVAINGNGSSVVAGALGNAAGGLYRGAVYAFTRAASTNANLGGLSISQGTLSPTFASGTTIYTAAVAYSVGSLTVTPTVADSNATVTVNGTTVTSGNASGPISLNVGPNTITVLVTAEDSTTTNSYTITVTRAAPSSNANLGGLAISQGTLSPTFASGITIYAAAVANSITSLTVTPTVGNATATVTVNGTTVTSGSASGPISLNFGPNTITVLVTAQDGTTTKSYTIAVTRAASSNANLSALDISQGTLSPTFASGTNNYTADVANSITSLTVTPTVADSTAIVTVNGTIVTSGSAVGPISLNVGPNNITILVAAQDGNTTRPYTIIVTRAASTNANLGGLSISQGTLSPTFASGSISYTAAVANSVGSLTVTPTVADSTATVKVNGTIVTSGSASGPISLNVGSNNITVLVTAQDGTTTQSYTITVTRAAASTNANLSGLAISQGTLSPTFASDTTSYTADVANSIGSLTVTPTVADSTATVTVNGTTVTSGSASGPITLNVGPNIITVLVTAEDGTTTNSYTITVTRAAITQYVVQLPLVVN